MRQCTKERASERKSDKEREREKDRDRENECVWERETCQGRERPQEEESEREGRRVKREHARARAKTREREGGEGRERHHPCRPGVDQDRHAYRLHSRSNSWTLIREDSLALIREDSLQQRCIKVYQGHNLQCSLQCLRVGHTAEVRRERNENARTAQGRGEKGCHMQPHTRKGAICNRTRVEHRCERATHGRGRYGERRWTGRARWCAL